MLHTLFMYKVLINKILKPLFRCLKVIKIITFLCINLKLILKDNNIVVLVNHRVTLISNLM